MLVLYEGARRLLLLSQPAWMPFGAKAYRPLVWGHTCRRCGAGSIIRVRKGGMPIATRGAVWNMRLMDDDPTASYLLKFIHIASLFCEIKHLKTKPQPKSTQPIRIQPTKLK